MTGTIFNIQKFCVNDGPGIRTTVFVKGCPLNCLWCHNPESKSTKPDILFDPRKCIGCGACAQACQNNCHPFTEEGHRFDRKACTRCGSCTEVCYAGALEKSGHTTTVEDALREVMKDKLFYENSGGGLTVSGGEPLAQFEFTRALLAAAKEQGLHTCVETCGFAPAEHVKQLAPLVDIFLFDYKLTDPELHKQYTGVSNEKILQNLFLLDELGAATVLRCPIIPTVNDTPEHLAGIANTANALRHVLEVNIEPYHPLGAGKSAMLGKDYTLKDLTFPADSTVAGWIDTIQSMTAMPVKKA